MAGLIMLLAMVIISCEKKEDTYQSATNENEPNETFESATELGTPAVFKATITKGDKDTYMIHPGSNIDISIDSEHAFDFHITACDENHHNIWEHSSTACNENHGHNNHSENHGNNDHQHNNGHHTDSCHLVHSIHLSEHQGTCYLIIENTNNLEGAYTISIE